ncbi:hypothetical protein DXA14_02445 [Hungatella hathewayi]|uniref:Uncharacterized protein n=1 Tax=Hungatella hathewayi DSM 13479 TaxID=566550 RepID=D3AQN3_9FIRM|nr:hypothetical protein CLOSTHATH_05939 [Hungatella hathewayi DSM 13479]RGZ07078.1 hypothetical protein DXA14_02445 [Hungatella hathewayi]RHB68018.1 hypothetical protein DW876_18475 [Hungatella hathewayi]
MFHYTISSAYILFFYLSLNDFLSTGINSRFLEKLVSQSKVIFFLSFGYDLLRCTQCNHKMQFVEIYYNHHRVSLEELYERAMAKVKCRSA